MGVDFSDAHLDLAGFIYEQGQKVVWWALFINREERLSCRRELYRLRKERETTEEREKRLAHSSLLSGLPFDV